MSSNLGLTVTGVPGLWATKRGFVDPRYLPKNKSRLTISDRQRHHPGWMGLVSTLGMKGCARLS